MTLEKTADVVQPVDILIDGITNPTVDLALHVERALSSFIRGGNTPHELQVLDELYANAGPAAQTQVETTASSLFTQTSVFDSLHFHSSLLTGGSQFFGAVLRRMGELVEANPALGEAVALPVLIRLTEHYRRKGDHKQMEIFAARVEEQLRERVEAGDTLALGQLAKVRYEQSMGHYNQKDFAQAIAIGDESATLSERAGDIYGTLAARGNSAGLYRYELARSIGPKHPDFARLLNEGRPALEDDLSTTQGQLAQEDPASLQHKKFSRVELNNAAHLMHIADLQRDAALARRMMTILENNPIYREGFDPKFPGNIAHAQSWIRPYTEIMQRLEQSGATAQ